MSGTVSGGKQAAKTNKRRYGDDFYRTISRMGGLAQVPKGFAMSADRAKEAGRKGGLASKHARKESEARTCWELYGHHLPREDQSLLRLWYDKGLTLDQAAAKCGITGEVARSRINRCNVRLYRYR